MATSDPQEPRSHAGPGALYNPMIPPHREDPYDIFGRLRQEEPVGYSPMFGMWIISRYDDVHRFLKDHRRFTTEGAFNKLNAAFQPEVRGLLSQSHTFTALNMLGTDKEHARLRAPLHKFFAAHNVSRYEPMIRRRASALIDRFPARGPVDLVEEFAYPLPLQVIFELIGVPDEDQPAIQQGVEAVGACMLSVVPPEQQVETVRRILAYERYLVDLIAQRQAEPRDALVSMLVQAVDSGRAQLNLAELVSMISTNLFLAGHETTVKAIGNGLYFLLANRQHWQALIDDPSRIPRAAEELLRLDGVVIGFFRTTTEPVTVRGTTIPAGESVLLLYASGNRDEERFTRPAEYDPDRRNLRDHIAFGYGMHYCLGAYLARMELRVVLDLLTTRLPGLNLVPDQEIIHSANMTLRGLNHLMAAVPAV
jgi:cytochrome P450